jgi:hypothetical protein
MSLTLWVAKETALLDIKTLASNAFRKSRKPVPV